MKEHKDDGENEKEDNKVSGLSQHIREALHRVDFENVKIINKESNFNKRKMKEAIAIKNNKERLLNKKRRD